MNLPVNIQPFYSVYRITNTVNGKAYIGVTKNLKRRMQAHMTLVNRGKGLALHSAMRKHGADMFTMEVLLYCGTLEYAYDAEIKCIKAFNTQSCGYNITAGGDGVRSLTDEAAARLRQSLSKALRGVKKSQAHVDAMSKARIGMKFSESHRMAISTSKSGVKASEEAKARMSASRMGRPMHPNTRSAILKSVTGRLHTSEYRMRLSKTVRRLRGRKVECIDASVCFPCLLDAKDWLVSNGHAKASPSAIGLACRGGVPRAYGHTWRYADAQWQRPEFHQDSADDGVAYAALKAEALARA